jgi:hypothetical protein
MSPKGDGVDQVKKLKEMQLLEIFISIVFLKETPPDFQFDSPKPF